MHVKSCLRVVLFAGAVLCSQGTHGEEKVLVRYDGKIDGKTPGWRFLESQAGQMVVVPFEGSYENKGGRIESPIIPLDKPPGKSAYYSLTFKATTPDHCYWWVDYFDSAGTWLPDTNSAVYPKADRDEYSQMIYVQGDAASTQIVFHSKGGVSASDIVMKQVSWETAAAWNDALYASLPPLEFAPPADAFALLPRTAAALASGAPWRVVMLGDSIVNDSFNSTFQALVKRDFPKSNLEFIISVRGATGCWYYEEPQHFAEYVARHRPDLLLIGGISNVRGTQGPEDVSSAMAQIRRVIEQAKTLGCEIAVMSPPHSVDWRPFDQQRPSAELPALPWNEETLDPQKKRPLLWTPFAETAKECGVAFFNITVPTADYVATSRKPHGYFNRDYVHNNDRGKQIIGRVLQRYFQTARPAPSKARAPDDGGLSLERDDHWLVIHGPRIPGGSIRINYLEAYCRAGSTDADWVDHTVIRHTSRLVSISQDRKTLRLRDAIADGVTVDHTITAGTDAVKFELAFHNPGDRASEVHWAQPCVRLAKFTGFAQDSGGNLDDYLPKCFVFLEGTLTRMPTADWAKEARYTPGQVWCPAGVPRTDVNPRPLSKNVPSNGLIGCFSKDETLIFATAWEPYQELFQGVARCLHADLRIGGLEPGEKKTVRGMIYVVPNQVDALLNRYRNDFPEHAAAVPVDGRRDSPTD